ncbi:MAG TPA: hypothetical protein VNO23_06385 [Candidatus Binatia bacterium]|nr:hypothetical protein [Candidatus Binatia bacterium]
MAPLGSATADTRGSGRPPSPPDGSGHPGGPTVLAIVRDLFLVARIRETARLTGVPLAVARSADEGEQGLAARPRLALLDLTADFDHDRILAAAASAGVPVLGFTTHALARRTQPWHGRCARVVTKETLTAELPSLLSEGVMR